MTSAKKQDANRRNASKSTGPRTEAGKLRAARNAFRHGLSIASLADPSWAPEVHAFASTLVAAEASPLLREQAYNVASAQIDLVRVRLARHNLVSRALADSFFEPGMQTYIRNAVMEAHNELPRRSFDRLMTSLSFRPTGDKKLAFIYSELFDALMRLDRYEQRALSARHKAMRRFNTASRRYAGSLVRGGAFHGRDRQNEPTDELR